MSKDRSAPSRSPQQPPNIAFSSSQGAPGSPRFARCCTRRWRGRRLPRFLIYSARTPQEFAYQARAASTRRVRPPDALADRDSGSGSALGRRAGTHRARAPAVDAPRRRDVEFRLRAARVGPNISRRCSSNWGSRRIACASKNGNQVQNSERGVRSERRLETVTSPHPMFQ